MFYLDLFRALEQHKVRYLLVGGLAMNFHGVPRMTMDVDIVLALDPKNKDAFVDASRSLKLRPVAPVSLDDLFDPVKRRVWIDTKNMIVFALRPDDASGPTVDILMDPVIEMEAAFSRAQSRDVQGVRIAFAAIDDLIRLKEHTGRAQDQADVAHLRRIRGISR